MISRFAAAAVVTAAALFLTSCEKPDGLNRGGELTGMIALDDKPIGGGRVEIYSADGVNAVGCDVRPDGGYTLKEPPLGDCKLVVKTSILKGMPPPPKTPAGPKPPAKENSSAGMVVPKDVGLVFVPIPAKYEELATTDLKVTVKSGKQTHDIKLASK
ncbi:hypothetical protein [Fimbriiglobus ruber]|uniref:Carboxypeptidase regulatory-like domain-containing protein n=1 Tax=Fimbriiglobus ruber TaxID=1908690 RepID=A0A225DE01_9BACT|nr:hypothetical protein [Fimbriiglobus ruber]OWK36748.1 hypothetical protein FRUB_09311 [Fimbriiglobus ruber]